MHPVETLLPVVLLILLGWLLARIRFLGPDFIAQLNKLTFYVALPAFILRSMTEVESVSPSAGRLFLLLFGCTVAAILVALALAFALGARRSAWGSVAQAAFRGNLAYGGLPILTYSLGAAPQETQAAALGLALLVFAPLTASYNFLAVLCLSPWRDWTGLQGWARAGVSILSNPLILSCLAGFALAHAQFHFPRPLHQALTSLGAVALPVALLCIGGSFIGVKLQGRWRSLAIAVTVKLVVLPLMAWIGCSTLGFHGIERKIAMIFASMPTAATAFTMAKEMGGDEVVSSAAVMLSTVLASFTLSIVLWLVN